MTNEDTKLPPLHQAVYDDNIAEAKLLIKGGANVDAKDEHGWTPLHWAAQATHIQIVQLLVKAKANVNAMVGDDGATPLFKAALDCRTETVLFLIKEGANVNAKALGEVPLHVAAKEGEVGIADALIKAGADLHICNDDGKTPLQIAVVHHGIDSDIARVFHRAMGLD